MRLAVAVQPRSGFPATAYKQQYNLLALYSGWLLYGVSYQLSAFFPSLRLLTLPMMKRIPSIRSLLLKAAAEFEQGVSLTAAMNSVRVNEHTSGSVLRSHCLVNDDG